MSVLADRLRVTRHLGRGDDAHFVRGEDLHTGEEVTGVWGATLHRQLPEALQPYAVCDGGTRRLSLYRGLRAVLAGAPGPWRAELVDAVHPVLDAAASACASAWPGSALGHTAPRHLAWHEEHGWRLVEPPVVHQITADHGALWRWELDQRCDDGGAWAAFSDVGPTRRVNEDAWAMMRHQGARLAVCADGMGGMDLGELGIRLALARVSRHAEADGDPVRLIERVHAHLLDLSEEVADFRSVGASVVALRLDASEAQVAWVGDCRAWRLREGRVEALTVDHTLGEEMVRKGRISAEEMRALPTAHILLRCVGMPSGTELDVSCRTVRVEPGEGWLLTTDGVHGACTWPTRSRGRWSGLRDYVRHLVQGAERDNAAAVLLRS